MRTPIIAAAVAASLFVTEAQAQLFNLGRKTAPAKADPSVKQASTAPVGATSASAVREVEKQRNNFEAPEPERIEDMRSQVPLPQGPLEPYLMTKQNGPFMVLAYTFRGPDAPRQALALTLELREKYQLPAYILLPKKYPGKSNIRGVPPQAPAFAMKDDLGLPELIRTLDEAAVMVGDEKTTKDAFDLMHKIKKLHPVCIDGVPQMWHFRKGQGLSRAITTTNPLVPAEQLFVHQPDVLLGKINDGPHNIRYCPGRFTLQIAAFTGRSTFDPENDPRFKGVMAAMKSPLATAADDAERLADALSKDKDIVKTGFQPYVYHDRFSSRVTIGSFNSPNDPAAQKLHDRLIELAVDLNNRKVSDNLIVPANELLDLKEIKPQLVQAPSATARR
ncbi:hypothetical protein P12x_000765 [Tundrisphaera lichenicola]|uniref:hypothetical protein n=1 Tax=Tundrisphaera lichenicola TaxID=2029860 RepID=UPI003EBB2EA3